MDQLNDFYSTCSKSLRWVCVALFYTLDTARVNAKTVFCMSKDIDPKKHSSFKFGWELSMQLAKPYVQARSLNGLTRCIQLKVNIMLDKASHPVQEPVADNFEQPGSRKRFHIHLTEARSKAEKQKAPKSQQMCHKCGKVACKHHTKVLCLKCIE